MSDRQQDRFSSPFQLAHSSYPVWAELDQLTWSLGGKCDDWVYSYLIPGGM